MDYTILQNGGKGVGGLLQAPSADMPTMWLAYVTVPDIDATVAKLQQLGGVVCKPPFEVPTVGRIAIVQDPQGAMFGLHSC
jgi:predicted enzyme related to lactoylglutathione lyase